MYPFVLQTIHPSNWSGSFCQGMCVSVYVPVWYRTIKHTRKMFGDPTFCQQSASETFNAPDRMPHIMVQHNKHLVKKFVNVN